MNTKRKRVLIVDDEASFTRLLQLNLHHTGRYMAEVVNDATKAVAKAREFDPDIILLDVMMPGMDGGDVAVQLQGNPALKNKPILFLTAAVKESEVHDHSGALGGLPFIAKPIDFQEVLEYIDKAVGPRLPAYMNTRPSPVWS